MRFKITLFLSLAIITYSQAQTTVDSKIKEVVVYLNGAKITRVAKTNLIKGENELVLSNLSDNIDFSSIQARVFGDGALLSVNYDLNFLSVKNNNKAIEAYKDSIESIGLKINHLDSELEVYQNEKNTLLKNDDLKSETTSFQVAELKALMDFQRVRGLELNDKIFKMNQIRIVNKIKLTKYQQQVQQLNGTSTRPKGEVILKVFSNKVSSINLELEYLVTNAGWNPIYDLRVDDLNKPADLVYKAQVRQNSGIDWKDVKMSISNGNPSRYQDFPELRTLYTTTHEEIKNNKRYYSSNADNHNWGHSDKVKKSPSRESVATGLAYSESDAEMIEYKVIQKENQLTSEYEINIPQSIPSDNKKHLVNITSYEMGVNFHYYAAPKISQSAYLLADIRDWGKYDLLSAEASIFFEGAFVGKTRIDPATTNDTLSISMGIDRSVQVKRTVINEKSGVKVLGFKKKLDYSYEFTVLNNKKEKITIEIVDQIPVAQKDEIEVSLEQNSGGGLNEKTGEITWKFDLEPNKSKKWEFMYSVKYPKNKIITGTK